MVDSDKCGPLKRGWDAWCRFWFAPADPTPLCLMRIVAGILTLYVHLAYSLDLVDFFGPNAWVGQRESNEIRTKMPHYRVRTDWQVDDMPFFMPPDPREREVLSQFIDRVLSDSNPDAILRFMSNLALAGSDRDELLRYLERPVDRVQLAAMMQEYVDEKIPAEELSVFPRMFSDQKTRESRQNLVDSIKRFEATLPSEATDRARLIRLFLEASPRDFGALRLFIERVGNMEPSQRGEFLEFLATWGVPSDRLYAKGMPVYSPWFHTTDERLLWMIHGLHLFVIVLFTLGMYTRVTSVMTWLVGLSYINRAQPYLFGQDTMMTLCLFYLMMSPCGAKWSIDRWMEKQRAIAAGREPPPVEPSVAAGFILRVFQVQYCFMYFSAGTSKLKGQRWWEGHAFFLCLANPEFAPMHMGIYRDFLGWMCSHRVLFELHGIAVSYFTLATELSFPFVVWTRLRPVAVAMALLLHAGIAIIMGLSVFSLFMFCLLICFIPPDAINWMFETKAVTTSPAVHVSRSKARV